VVIACELGVQLKVGTFCVQTPIVVETVLEILLAWSALAAVTEDVSVPLVLPDTA
jgi:hypothetical protein